jgi:hypothetical protein
MQQQELAPDGEQPDQPSTHPSPPSDQGLKQILAGEDLLQQARTISRRIWKRVRKLLQPDEFPRENDGGSFPTDHR